MAKVVVKGEAVYQCDQCDRKLRTPINKQGLDVLQRCNITYACKGKLHRLAQAKDINDTPAFPPEVQGIQDWFQRRVLYTHTQPVQSTTWLIEHNLTNKPILHVYVNRNVNGKQTLVSVQPTDVTTINVNTTSIRFDAAESGLVQCVALSSQNSTNPGATALAAASAANVQITSDTGELTIATLNSAPLIGATVNYVTSSATVNVGIEYISIDSTPSVESPWVGTNAALINGRRYTIRSFNMLRAPLAPAYFSAGQIPNGSAFTIQSILGAAPQRGECLILLSKAPHATVDRIYDQYIDVSTINPNDPETFYDTGKAFVDPLIIRSTYPSILLV